jgi:hypothetical protein
MKTSNPAWDSSATRRGLQRGLVLALTALLCLVALDDTPGGVVHASETCDADPGDSDYCWTSQCGPCGAGEGDCDPGQCESGLECVEEGSVDRCRDGCSASPGAGDYCSTSQCGPCGEGEGDCDPGQCQSGLECVEEGSVDRCRAVDDCNASPGAGDYCSTSQCGPCSEGEGDCDPGQCQSGLVCVEEGSVDRCRDDGGGDGYSNFQVKLDGVWKGVCCNDGRAEVSDGDCWWTEGAERDRVLIDETANRELDCPEGSPTDCDCDGWGEPMHGINGWSVSASLSASNGGPIYSDEDIDTCVYVKSSGELATRWTDSSCPSFRLQ